MKKSSITKSLTRKLVLASLAAGPVALVPTLRALPSTASTNLTAPSSVTWATGQLSNELDITSTAANTVLQWKNFGSGTDTIASGDIIKFNLPSSTSGVLNMVTGGTMSTIAGAITSNGRVYVLNTAGVMISSTAQINAASFVASTTNDTDATQSFLATGDLSYSGTAQGDITEAGKITGNVYLAGKAVSVSGDPTTNTINGELKINATGAVTLTGANVTGNLNIKNAASIELAGTASTTNIAGNATLVSSGAITTNGTFANSKSGAYTTTVDAGSQTVKITGNLDALTITNGGAVTTSGKLSTLTLTNAASASVTDSVALAVSGKTTGGNLSVTETGGDVTLGNTTVAGGLTVSDTAATSNVAMASGAAVSATGTVSLSATKSVSFTGSGAITLDATTLAPTATISGSGNITSSGGALAAGVTTLSVTSTGGNIDFSATAINNTATSLTLNANGTLKTGSINDSNTGTTKLTGSSVTTGSIDTKDLWVTTNNGTATLGTVGGLGALNSATLSITGADIALPTLSATTLTVTGSGQVTSANVLTSTSASVTAGDAITLSGANAIGSLKLVDSTTKAVSVTNSSDLVLANGTNVAGATTIDTSTPGKNITFGAGASDTLTFAGLTLKAGTGSVTEANKTLSLTTGNLAVTANSIDVESTNNSFGTLSGTTTGAATFVESSAIDAGALNVGGNLMLTSNTGISTSGVLTVAGTAGFDLTSAGDVTLNTANAFSGNVSVGAGGKVANVDIKSSGALNLDKIIATTGVTINSTGAITQTGNGITAPSLSITGVATTLNSSANKLGTVTLATNGAVTVDNSTGDLTVGGSTKGGNLIVANQGAGNLTYNASVTDNSTVSLTAGVASSKAGDITVNGSTSGNGLLTATANDGKIHLGSYYSAAGGLTLNTAATSGMGVDDVSGSRANIYGNLSITTAGGTISLINNAPDGIKTSTATASRFGGYYFDTTNGGASANGADINVMEGGTIRIGSVQAGKGNITLTATSADSEFASNPSDIVSSTAAQLTADGSIVAATNLKGNNITLNARNSVTLNQASQVVTAGGFLYAIANTDASLHASDVTLGSSDGTSKISATGIVDAIASRDVLINSSGAIELGGGNAVTGDFYAGGALSVYAAGNITQDTSRLRAKSTVTLNAGATNNIDLSTGTDNEFGGMKLTGKTVKITENGSTRLLSASATDLTVTSAGDIIDAMIAGASDPAQAITVSGTATFAPSGMLSLTNTNNSIANLKVTAPGASQNVTLVDNLAVTLVDGTNIGGNFTLTDSASNSGATPINVINEAAASTVSIGGTASFTANQGTSSSISVLGTNNQFGKLAFQSNGAVSITQSTNMVLVAGNTGGGSTNKFDTVLQSVNGGISTDSVAGSTASFAGNVRLYSHGNVAIDAPWNVGSTLYITTPSSATLDLSGLSLAGNLNGTKPMWNGTAIAAGTDGLMQ